MNLKQRVEQLEAEANKTDAKLGHWSTPIERFYGESEEDFPDVWEEGPVPTLAEFYAKQPSKAQSHAGVTFQTEEPNE